MSPGLSYVHGTTTTPLIGETIGARFDNVVATRGERDAVVARHQGIRWSWAELGRRVDAFAAGLVALGLEPGDRIAICANNRAEWVVTQYAAAKAGLILVSINPAVRAAELKRFLTLVGARALVLQDRFKTTDYVAMLRELAPELDDAEPGQLRSAGLPSLEIVIRLGHEATPGTVGFDAVPGLAGQAERDALAQRAATAQFDAPAAIMFSSATGSRAAGATLTHHNLLNNAYFAGATLRLTGADRVCVPLPLYHTFGMVVGNLACLAHAATVVYPGEAFDPGTTLETIAAERCTAVYGVPAMFIAMLEHPDFARHDLSSLRTGIMGGAPCPIETMRKVASDMHMSEVTIGYGMTETSPISFMSDVDDSLERRVSTVGTIRPHVEAKVIDAEGRIVPRGTPGELCIRGYNVMLGYWDDPELTAAVLDGARWMHTGDLAEIDDQGYCRIVGGIKDIVIRGGENIFPVEVEEFLEQHPAIAEAIVVGVPDRRLGEELCACIRLEPGHTLTAEEVREYCKGRIAHYKIPRYVRFHERFPASAGRALKFMLREQSVAELGLQPA